MKDQPGAEDGALLVSDAARLGAIAAGDHRAFADLFNKYARNVYRYTASIVGRTAEAEDACQEVWTTLWRSRGRIRLATETLLPWLLVTARYKSLHAVKRMQRDDASALSDQDGGAAPDSDRQAEMVRLLADVEALVQGLPELDREVFRRCIHDGKDYATVSKELGITVASTRNRLSRTRKKARTALTLDS